MTTTDIWKIRCGECNHWLMRVEGGYVYAICPKCKAEIRVEIVQLVQELRNWLDALEEHVGAERGTSVVTTPRWDRKKKHSGKLFG